MKVFKKVFNFFKGMGVIGFVIGFFAMIFTPFAGWINHIIYCFEKHEYVLLLVGAVFAPIGSIHGIGLWFNVW